MAQLNLEMKQKTTQDPSHANPDFDTNISIFGCGTKNFGVLLFVCLFVFGSSVSSLLLWCVDGRQTFSVRVSSLFGLPGIPEGHQRNRVLWPLGSDSKTSCSVEKCAKCIDCWELYGEQNSILASICL